MNAGHHFIADKALLAFDLAESGLAVTIRDEGSLSAPEATRLMAAVAANRDRVAFAALFGFYAPRLKAFLKRSGMTPSAAEDVVQETMLLVWKKASYFDPARAGVSTWIFTIARNARIDRLRRESRPAVIAEAFDPSDQPDAPVSGEQAIIAETVAGIAEILGGELDRIRIERAVVGLFFTGVKLSGGAEVSLPTKPANLEVKANEAIVVETPGAGGYGKPAERDKAAVENDFVSGKFSRGFIKDHYGVEPKGKA